jgi:hypothetical protein
MRLTRCLNVVLIAGLCSGCTLQLYAPPEKPIPQQVRTEDMRQVVDAMNNLAQRVKRIETALAPKE